MDRDGGDLDFRLALPLMMAMRYLGTRCAPFSKFKMKSSVR